MLSMIRRIALATIALVAVGCDQPLCEEHVLLNAEENPYARVTIEVGISKNLVPIIDYASMMHGPIPTVKCPLCNKMIQRMAPEMEREHREVMARIYAR